MQLQIQKDEYYASRFVHGNSDFSLLPKVRSINVQKVSFEISEIINSAKIDLTSPPGIPPTCLEIVNGITKYPIASVGSFSVLMGKAKSRKTFLTSMILAAMLIPKNNLDIFKHTELNKKSRIILFDTEQPKHKAYEVGKRIQYLAQITDDFAFEVYSLRSFAANRRHKIIEQILYSKEDILLVAIDGIRDLMYDINDPAESSELVSDLMKWSEEREIHILNILHQNKSDTNARGHLGTELVNKAETVISVKKSTENTEISIVEAEYCREKDFPPFAFSIDSKGIPYVLNDWVNPTKPGSKKKDPSDFPDEIHKKIIDKVFERELAPQYRDMLISVRLSLESNSIIISERRVKDFLKYYKEKKLIVEEKILGKKYPVYKKCF